MWLSVWFMIFRISLRQLKLSYLQNHLKNHEKDYRLNYGHTHTIISSDRNYREMFIIITII